MFDQQIQRWVGMTPDLGMDVEVTDPDDEIMLSRVYYDVLVYICTGSYPPATYRSGVSVKWEFIQQSVFRRMPMLQHIAYMMYTRGVA